MQDRLQELRIKLRVIKETPEMINILADMLEISTKDSFIMIAKLRHKYQKEVKSITDKEEVENQKQQKLF